MGLKWFVQNNDVVDGPMGTEEVHSRLKSGFFKDAHLIWGQGFSEWQTLSWWKAEIENLSKNQPEAAPELWHYATQGQSHGPMTRPELISDLKNLSNVGDVVVWTRGMTEWIPLFEFHDLLNDVGVNKRQFPRVDVTGRCVIKTESGSSIAQLTSIGEGGCGVLLGTGLSPGQEVSVELHSPALSEVIYAKAECRFSRGGILGLRFTQISVENKGTIIQYVRQVQAKFILKAA